MRLYERELDLDAPGERHGLIDHLARSVGEQLEEGDYPVRFVVSSTQPVAGGFHCEVGVLEAGPDRRAAGPIPSIFEFRRRAFEDTAKFRVVLLVPTGINAMTGGHAGDAGPVARLLAGTCDTLITHPNAVNGSDINENPDNALYVEGSVICRLLMGTAGLRPVRSNRVLVAIDRHEEIAYSNAAIDAVNAARACYGFDCPRIVMLDPGVKLVSACTSAGRAAGRVDNLGAFLDAVGPYLAECDAVAVSSVIDVPPDLHRDDFDGTGSMVNPWGGVEAIFTHALSLLYGIPSAHSPMIESEEVEAADPGVVDPRMAAETVSLTLLQSILKGLRRSPRIETDPRALESGSILTARDVSCLVIPNGYLGLPTLAALEQGIPVIAVRDGENLMHNDLLALPWSPGQFMVVDGYLEAAGLLAALRAGLAPDSLLRPIRGMPVTAVSLRNRGPAHARANGRPRRASVV